MARCSDSLCKREEADDTAAAEHAACTKLMGVDAQSVNIKHTQGLTFVQEERRCRESFGTCRRDARTPDRPWLLDRRLVDTHVICVCKLQPLPAAVACLFIGAFVRQL